MKIILVNIINILKRRKKISHKQFLSVIKFLEREREFKHYTHQNLISLFTPIIYNKPKENSYEDKNTLETFFSKNNNE